MWRQPAPQGAIEEERVVQPFLVFSLTTGHTHTQLRGLYFIRVVCASWRYEIEKWIGCIFNFIM